MDNHLISRIREILAARDDKRRSVAGHRVLFSKPGLDSIPITSDNLRELDGHAPQLRCAFVDGGIGDVFVSPSMSVHLLRIHSSVWSHTKRMRMHTQEAFIIVLPRTDNSSLVYDVSFYPRKGFLLPTTPQTYPAVFKGLSIPIITIGNKARVVLEALECERLCDDLGKGDIVVRDGLIHSPDEMEQQAFDRAAELAQLRGVSFIGLAKTSNLYTDFGDDALRCVSKLGTDADLPWMYYPLANRAAHSIADPCIVKLHSRASHVFLLEALLAGDRAMIDVVRSLIQVSCDGAFLGYPYPLVLADRLARVANAETDAMKCRLLAACKTEAGILNDDLTSLDAHLVLDAM